LILVQLPSILGMASSGAAVRLVGPVLCFAIFSILAVRFSPGAEASAKAATDALDHFQRVPQQDKADFIAAEAARRLRISSDDFSSPLVRDLRFAPREVMNLLEDLGAEYDLPLSEDNYPEINSIDTLVNAVRRHTTVQ